MNRTSQTALIGLIVVFAAMLIVAVLVMGKSSPADVVTATPTSHVVTLSGPVPGQATRPPHTPVVMTVEPTPIPASEPEYSVQPEMEPTKGPSLTRTQSPHQ